jgi:hypothetical protein
MKIVGRPQNVANMHDIKLLLANPKAELPEAVRRRLENDVQLFESAQQQRRAPDLNNLQNQRFIEPPEPKKRRSYRDMSTSKNSVPSFRPKGLEAET